MGTRKGWDEPGDWDGHVYIVDTMDKIGQERGPPVAHRGLCRALRGPTWEGEPRKRHLCAHIAVPLCFKVDTSTTL